MFSLIRLQEAREYREEEQSFFIPRKALRKNTQQFRMLSARRYPRLTEFSLRRDLMSSFRERRQERTLPPLCRTGAMVVRFLSERLSR